MNALGIRRIMFAVDDIDAVVARLLARGAELVGEICSTRTRIGSLTSAALKGSLSRLPSSSAKAFPHGRRRTARASELRVGLHSFIGV